MIFWMPELRTAALPVFVSPETRRTVSSQPVAFPLFVATVIVVETAEARLSRTNTQ